MELTEQQFYNLKNLAKILNDFIQDLEGNTERTPKKTALYQHEYKKVSLEEILKMPHDIKNVNIDPRIYPNMPAEEYWKLYPELRIEGG